MKKDKKVLIEKKEELEQQDESRYSFKVKNKHDMWESWTGSFNTLKEAESWYEKYGRFHEDRGHILGLFYKGEYISKFNYNK